MDGVQDPKKEIVAKIAGHSDLEMTGEYTFVVPERRKELTRRIQRKLAETEKKQSAKTERTAVSPAAMSTPEAPQSLVGTEPLTPLVQ